VAVEQLAAVNSIDSPYIIWVGQVLELQASQVKHRVTVSNEGGSNLLLPSSLTDGPIKTNSSSMGRKVFCWDRSPSAGGGAGFFWNDSANGYYRYANGKWQPIVMSPKVSLGVWGEFGDDFCQVIDGDWSQTSLGFKVGPVLDFCSPGYWFNSWSLKTYYGFRHADSRNGAWSKIQKDETWSANLWIGVHQGTKPWFAKTSISAEYTGLISADAVGGNNGQNMSIPTYSPIKWESSVEQSLYKWGDGSFNFNLGYRHLDGEADPAKDRVLYGIDFQFGWAKVLYEMEVGEKQQQKLEAQLSF
jgi:hypothetical protein